MKIALVHDHLIQDGGAEKTLDALMDIWPEAPTFTLFFDPERLPSFRERSIKTSFLQKMPLSLSRYQWYLPLMPTATEKHDLRDYDVIVSSSSAFAKGVITRADALHVCYCHTPTRYLWSDTHSYIDELRMPGMIKSLLPPLLSYLRMWDRQAADRVDHFLANSHTVKQRIFKYYGKQSDIVHPPVDVEKFEISDEPKKYFLTGGRLVAYKKFDLVVEAANKTGLPLKVFGTGPLEGKLRKYAKDNVEILGKVPQEKIPELYANAKAFIHPHVEDFGITAIESMAAGRPVIAYRRGGATETVEDGVTGEFFDEQSWEELADHMIRFDSSRYYPTQIREHALKFNKGRFQTEVKDYVESKWKSHARRVGLV